MADSESIITISLAIIGILITLIIPIPLEDEYRLFIIASLVFTFLFIISMRFDKRLEDINKALENKEKEIEGLNKRFKTLEDLNDIRLDLKELQREVFKK